MIEKLKNSYRERNLKPLLNSTLSSECALSAGAGWSSCCQIVMSYKLCQLSG